MDVLITLTTAGTDTGPFNLFSDVDGFTSPFETGVSKLDLLAGYATNLAPGGTTIVRVKSEGLCTNFIDIVLTVPTTTTTTSTCPTYYELVGCEPEDYAFTTIAPYIGPNQQFVLPGISPVYYTATGASITTCIVPSSYDPLIEPTENLGCP
jgi:hypothetical protein